MASAWEVGRFNDIFSEMRRRIPDPPIEACWIGVLISALGYRKLGVDMADLPATPGAEAFKAGMAQRAAEIGDTRPKDAPSGWIEPFRQGGPGIDLAVLIAADDPDDLNATLRKLRTQIQHSGCSIAFEEAEKRPRSPRLRGIDHFGFRDGVSQPAIDGYNDPPQHDEPLAVPAGEFVLGYPDISGVAAPVGPRWTDGSFVVFRRLKQDVAGFRVKRPPPCLARTPS